LLSGIECKISVQVYQERTTLPMTDRGRLDRQSLVNLRKTLSRM
jgi:hypothetical protein